MPEQVDTPTLASLFPRHARVTHGLVTGTDRGENAPTESQLTRSQTARRTRDDIIKKRARTWGASRNVRRNHQEARGMDHEGGHTLVEVKTTIVRITHDRCV